MPKSSGRGMDTLLRSTILGQCIRFFRPSAFTYVDERNPGTLNSLAKPHNVSSNEDGDSQPTGGANERTSLLAHGQHSDLLVVDWYDVEDPDNPLNWPVSTKVIATAETCVLTVAIYMGSSLWSVCIDDAIQIFDISDVVAQLGTSLFVLGFGLGPMLFSPLSEIPRVGRLRVYFWTTILYILCQLPVLFSRSIHVILVFRFFTGVFCSPCLAVGGGTVADMFDPKSRGYPLAFWELATWGGSAIGPVFGGFVFERWGFPSPMWLLLALAIFALVTIVCLLPETLPSTILHQRAQRLERINPHVKFIIRDDLKESQSSFAAIVRGLFVKAIALNFQEPIVFVLNLYVALVFAIFFGMLESFPFVFKGPDSIYGFNTSQTGLTFLGKFTGGVLALVLYIAFLWFYQTHHFDKDGNITPEKRLIPAIFGGFCVPIGLFWYGWSASEDLHWIMPVIGGFWFGIGMFSVFMVMLSYLPDAYPSVAATVIAGNCLMRATLAAAFPLFTVQFYSSLGPGWASSILGFLGCLFVPYPFFLYRYGKSLRLKSRNARKDL